MALTFGNSGGHESGVCYKCGQDDGNLCGGYCSPDHEDNYQHYWSYDVDDLLAVAEGQLEPHEAGDRLGGADPPAYRSQQTVTVPWL
ncbi:MAG: hypothetical protein JRI68_01990 [Deltaproteobacteria bacterium]|nr:hypothetical protein [Deltaproteobacteria bacterium]